MNNKVKSLGLLKFKDLKPDLSTHVPFIIYVSSKSQKNTYTWLFSKLIPLAYNVLGAQSLKAEINLNQFHHFYLLYNTEKASVCL